VLGEGLGEWTDPTLSRGDSSIPERRLSYTVAVAIVEALAAGSRGDLHSAHDLVQNLLNKARTTFSPAASTGYA
jgi:hypothetical protein